jgi:hypothetical protein
MLLGPVHWLVLLPSNATRLSELVLDPKPTPGIRPLDVAVDVADDAAGAALDASLVREHDSAVILGNIAVGRATIDALLTFAPQADVVVDDPDMGAGHVDIVGVERELPLDRSRI